MLCSEYYNIFHKIFSMSKKKKVILKKVVAKKQLKKPVKKAAKPVVKKAVKPSKSKKPVKPVLKKSVKVSKPVKKAITKKVVKPLKSKVIAKKPIKKVVKKAALPKKVVAKKTIVKPTKVKAIKAKPVETKAPVNKPIAKVIPPPAKPIKVVKVTAASIEKAKKAEELQTKKQLAEKKSQEVLAITNTIPVKTANEISASKIASISHSITNPIKKIASYSIKPEKEPNGKFEIEFVVHSSAEMLYEFLSTPSGLSEWFCDDLNIRNGIYTFIWEDQLQQARLLKTIELQLVRFQWVDKTDGSYFEFRIQRDDLTNDISLIITDFADTVSERESAKLLWHSQIEKLMHVIGSIF